MMVGTVGTTSVIYDASEAARGESVATVSLDTGAVTTLPVNSIKPVSSASESDAVEAAERLAKEPPVQAVRGVIIAPSGSGKSYYAKKGLVVDGDDMIHLTIK